MNEENASPSSSTVITVGIVAACYAVVNGLCVFLPFIPGMGTFVAWGLFLPLLFLSGSWVALGRQRHAIRKWWMIGIFATVAYAAMGFLSLYIIAAMWAAV